MNDYHDFEFVTQTQLGKIFGVGSKVMGKWLTKIGLRDGEHDPTKEALQGGYCKLFRNDRDIVFFVWHRNKTIEALKAGGYDPMCEQPETILATGLVGPFSLYQTSEDGFQVRNGDTTCCLFVRGARVGKQLVALLNHVHGRGGFGD
jgi:hypothetical protein